MRHWERKLLLVLIPTLVAGWHRTSEAAAEPARMAVSRADSLRIAGDLPAARALLLGVTQRALDETPPDSLTAARSEALQARIDRGLQAFLSCRRHDERAMELYGPDGARAPAEFRAAFQHYVGILRSLGEYDLALTSAQKLLAIRRATKDLPQAEMAMSFASIASVYADLGRFEEATPMLQQAYELQRATSGPEHVSTLGRLINLGHLAMARADYNTAESIFVQVVDITSRAYSPVHLMMGANLYSLAVAHHRLHQDSLAMCEGERAAAIRRDAWRAMIPNLPELQALQLTNEYWRGHEIAIEAALAQQHPDRTDLARLWHTALVHRTLVLDETVWRQRERHDANTAASPYWTQWEATRQSVSRLVTAGFDLRRDPHARTRLDSLRAAADSLELLALAQQPRLGPARAARAVTWEQIEQAVPAGTALVGCFRYGRVKQATPLDRWRMDLDYRYSALVLDGTTREIKAVALGDATTIDSLATAWTALLSEEHDDGTGAQTAILQVGEQLRTRIWDPIQDAIGNARHVILVPDGELNRVPWEALPLHTNKFLIEGAVDVDRLFSERDLVRTPPPPRGVRRMLAVGGPDFETPSPAVATIAAADPVRTDRGIACLRQSQTSFPPLPASSAEAAQFARLARSYGWSSALLRGREASVSRLLADMPGATWVHIATHGYSLADSCLPADFARDQWLFEPLARHGLVLAGANRGSSSLRERGDALLRGSEIAMLDLSGVDEVDLSTCRSGAGNTSVSEGVFGLSRAFRIAGARCIVTSQWPIGDETGARWASEYVKARLAEGLSPSRAARQASRAILARQRRHGLTTSPRLWASFAVWGDTK